MIAMSPVISFDAPPTVLQRGAVARLPAAARSPRWRRPSGLIIDLDNTLYPTRRFVTSGFAAVAAHVDRRFGVVADDAFTHLAGCLVQGNQSTAFQSLCATFSLSADAVSELVRVYRDHRPNIFLGRGAREMLTRLRAAEWRLAVLTNGAPSVQEKKVQALGIADLVDHVIYAERVVPGGKPSGLAFAEARERLGTRVERTICLGDDPRTDIAGAREAGLATIRLALPDVTVPAGQDADIVVDVLTAVPGAARALVEGVSRHVA